MVGLAPATPGAAEIKVAVVYSSWHGYHYSDWLYPIFKNFGWKYDGYENTKLKELMPKLNSYNMVVFMATYNCVNEQDFSQFAPEWKTYMESGGCLVVTDANYVNQVQWLSTIDKRLACGNIRRHGQDVTVKWIAKDHPLLNRVKSPMLGWGQITSWSPAWIPLAKDSMGFPFVAYQEISNGVVVISTCYADHDWPPGEFLNNLSYWAKSPVRIKALKAPTTQKVARPRLEIPMSSKSPIIDGVVNPAEWNSAAEIPEFTNYVTQTATSIPKTRCRITQGADDLYVLFECTINEFDSALSITQMIIDPEREECVEIFLNPIGKDQPFLHFAVSISGTKWARKMDGNILDRYWLAETKVQNNHWTTELQIPFTSLGLSQKTPASTIWKANFSRRYHPNSRQSEAFTWAPALTPQELIKDSGLLTGIKTNCCSYNIQPQIMVHSPAKWLPGENRIRLEISKLSQMPQKAKLVLKKTNSIEEIESSQTIILNNEKVNSVFFPVKLKNNDRFSGQFVLFDTNFPSRILASSETINVNIESLMEADLILPAYRNIVQSKDPKKDLVIRGKIEKAELSNLLIETQARSELNNNFVWQENSKVQAGYNFEVKTSLAKWPVGKYHIRMTLTSDKTSNPPLMVKEFEISILPPAPFEVTFDERRICFVNGKAFFPIGLYHTSSIAVDSVNNTGKELGLPVLTMKEMLKDIKEHGFNTIFHTHARQTPDEEYMKLSSELGLYIVPEIGIVDENAFVPMVNEANRYRNVLMWYNMDEPPLNKIRFVLPKVYELYQKLDPHRPTAAATGGECMNYFMDAFDVLMQETYSFTNKGSTLASDGVEFDKGLAISKSRKPFWTVPQAFAYDGSYLVEPTPEQLRAEAYFSIIHGATGLMWYAYIEGTYAGNPKGRNMWYLAESKLWPFFKELNKEFSQVTPIILNGQSLGLTQGTSKTIHAALWSYSGSSYLIAVNPTDKIVKCGFDGIKPGSVEVLFENRQIPVSKDSIEDNFNPFERHIYKLKGQ
jgi:hypothetical protein